MNIADIHEAPTKFDLINFTIRDLTECGKTLRQMGERADSMEEVSNKVVQYLYDSLVDGQSGERACALVRFFKTHDYENLDDDLKNFALNMLESAPPLSNLKCLVLLASIGEKIEWRSREASGGHKAIPLPSEKAVTRIPMIRNIIKQLGLEVTAVIEPDARLLLDMDQKSFNVFFVPNALGSPHIPAQANFVVPFGIKSVLGFGGVLPSGNIFVVIMFLKVQISKEVADFFSALSLNLKMAILPFEKSVFLKKRKSHE